MNNYIQSSEVTKWDKEFWANNYKQFIAMTETKEKKQRVPRAAESILAGALKLTIGERIALWKTLKESIQKEMEEARKKTAEIEEMVNGL